MKYYILLISLLCCLANISAQDSEEMVIKKFPIQLSTTFSIGSHGKQGLDYIYNLSLNLVAGKARGINGAQFSVIYGQIRGAVNGLQVAGFTNSAAFINGIQISGLTNYTVVTKGIQISGLINAASVSMGMQIAGIVNGAADLSGIQIGGIGNAAAELRGIQIGGLRNTAVNLTGLQIGGVNQTHTLKGVTIGLVSITDTIAKGVSLSLINIVKRGFYREWELSFANYANVALSYKMGMRRFYTLYTVGANFIDDKLWIAGIGFGNCSRIGKRFDFQPEIATLSYFSTNFKKVESAFETHLKLGLVYRVTDKFGFSLAPSVYLKNKNKAGFGLSLGLKII